MFYIDFYANPILNNVHANMQTYIHIYIIIIIIIRETIYYKWISSSNYDLLLPQTYIFKPFKALTF